MRDGKASVVRHEARLRRDAVRTLGLPANILGGLDDPWVLLEHLADVWGYVVGLAPNGYGAPRDGAPTDCATSTSPVDVAWIRRVIPDADSNRSRWPTDPVWQLVQAAPFTDVSSKARRLMRREQHVHAVEQLDAGAYGYLVSRTALLHPKGETFDVSMGLRGFFEALTKIAAQPEKDFGELVRQRRRKRGLAVAPTGKILPLLPVWRGDLSMEGIALDRAAERLFIGDCPADELRAARIRLGELRMKEALLALDEAGMREASTHEVARLEQVYEHELTAYGAAIQRDLT